MGSSSSKHIYYIPIPIISFESVYFDEIALNKFKEHASTANHYVERFEAAVKSGKLVDELGSSNLKKIVEFLKMTEKLVDKVVPVFTLLDLLADTKTESLQRDLDKLGLEMYRTSLIGHLVSLKAAHKNIKKGTSKAQLVAELTCSIREFRQILPIFDEGTLMYKYYYLAAPMFLEIYSIFKFTTVIAEASAAAGFTDITLPELKKKYAATHQSYKERCIRQRLRSIHIIHLNQGAVRRHNYDELVTFSDYFTADKCGRDNDEEAVVRRAVSRRKHSLNVMDDWDSRPAEKIEFREIELDENEREFTICLREYRKDVKNLMEEFFDGA